jgi:flagellar motility protein MotE (MotC chaperone)
MILDPSLSGLTERLSGIPVFSDSRGTAQAAAAQGPAAPPAVTPSLPGGPNAADAPAAPQQRALPSISSRQPPQGNATAPAGSPDLVREALARKQEDLARKDQELRVLDSEISAKLEQMQILENRLAAMIKDAENTRDAKFRHLVDVLSNMKARQAAAVLETLDQKIAVNVLAGMRGRQAGEILSFVRPETAAHLAEALARMQLPFE